MKPNILTYLDYRLYLSDVFEHLKQKDPRFSYRAFGRMADSPSPNFLQFLKQRKLHLSQHSLDALAASLGFNAREKRYLETLVQFDHAKTHEEKDRYFRQVVSTREYGKFKQLQESQYRYLSHWYMPVIRELITSTAYSGDPAWIAERIVPQISVSKARKGVVLLEKLGLIRHDEETGRWEQNDRVVRTPSEVIAVAVVKYYRSIFALASDSMERFHHTQRDVRGVTVGVSAETYRRIKTRMESFWNEIMAMASEPQEVGRVYHVGLQVFPLSEDIKE
ncbi:MAG: TIGR02147 family protein [Chitinivibrionales bacterium]|nr:TIGR02147 family protein [Chitinivibrionales bacterium]MBD3396826.1 TIGR02147 family protein [Chitinivibrionales bacterium]